MAASELLGDAQSGENVHLEVSVTMESPPPPPPPPRPAKTGGGPRPAPSSSSSAGKRIHDDRRASTRLMRTLHRGLTKHRGHYVRIPAATAAEGGRGGDPLPSEWWRTGVALVYALSNLLLTCVVITAAHERVPDKALSPPLPDKFFDYVERVPWAFTVTEANGILLMALWFVQWLFLKHKSIIGRRCFFLIGTLYLYRCVTMYITTLPVPSKHFNCAPKLNGDSEAMLRRILGLISGGGLSLTGQQLLCGDFLYSGHTVMLTLAYLFIKEYSPPSLWWYQWICWLLSAGGVVCILIGHEHYSIDVVIAYFITSRLFWWYHTMANSQALRGTPNNYLSRTWWNPLFNFLEQNVQTRVPCVFSWPVSLPSCCSRSPCERYFMVQSGRDE